MGSSRWARISDACLVVILDSGFISSCNEKCTMDSEALSLDSGFASSYSRKSRNGFRIMDSDSGFASSCSEKCRMDSDSGFGFWIPDSLTRVAEKVEMDSDSDSLLVEAVFGQMDSQNGFGFGVRCFKNMFVDENLQYRR